MSGEGFPSELLHSHKSCRSACQNRGFLLSSEKMQADSGGVFRRLRQNVVCCTHQGLGGMPVPERAWELWDSQSQEGTVDQEAGAARRTRLG